MSDTLKVRITKAGFKAYWYAEKIGEIFTVEPGIGEFRCVGGPIDSVTRWISADDCEIVTEPDKCPGCVTKCEDCDKPLSVAEYQANFPLAPWGYLEQLERRIAKLESIIQERTADS